MQGDEAAFGAAVPALGLSNKAIYLSDSKNNEEGPDLAPVAQPASISERPLEEHLQQSTLWPEVFKVYGHGNEIFALAAAPEGGFLASACKAQVSCSERYLEFRLSDVCLAALSQARALHYEDSLPGKGLKRRCHIDRERKASARCLHCRAQLDSMDQFVDLTSMF